MLRRREETGAVGNVHISMVKLSKTAFLAVLDQALYAISNLLLQVAIARSVTANEFGAYTVGSALFFIAALTHQTFVIEPMVVFSERRYEDRIGDYYRMLRVSWSLRFGLGVFLVGISGAGAAVATNAALLAQSFAAFAFVSPFLLYFWLLRRMVFMIGRIEIAVLGGTVYAAVLGITLLLAIWNGWMSSWLAILLSGVSAMLASAAVHMAVKWPNRSGQNTTDGLGRHFKYGRWAFGAETVNWCIQNGPILLVPLWYGLGAAGTLRVLNLLLMPLFQVISAMGSILLRRFSSMKHINGRRDVTVLWFLLFCVGSAYSVVLVVVGPSGLTLLFGPDYAVDRSFLSIAGLLGTFLVSSQAFFIFLRSVERSNDVLIIHLIVLAIVSTMTFLLLSRGVFGVLTAQAIGWFWGMLVAMALADRYRRSHSLQGGGLA